MKDSRRWLILPLLLLLALAAPARAEEEQLPSRLFLTPIARARLEARRWHRPPPRDPLAEEGPELASDLPPLAPPPPEGRAEALPEASLTLKGVVLRSSGKQTVWLNDRSYSEGTPLPSGVTAPDWSSRQRISIIVGAPGGATLLQPGQTLNRASGETREGYKSSPPPSHQGEESDGKK